MSRKIKLTPKGAEQVSAERVAARAGVSAMSVSRYFHMPDMLSEKTRVRIELAVAELNYIPNRLAQNLRESTSGICALMVPSVTNMVFADVISELSISLGAAGYELMVHTTRYDQKLEAASLNTALGFRPAAVILPGLEHEPAAVAQLKGLSVPVVEIMDLEKPALAYGIGFDQQRAQVTLMQHLWDRGCRKFAYIGANLQGDLRAMKRLQAARAFLVERNMNFVFERNEDQHSSPEIGAQIVASLGDALPTCDAIVCSNDDIATGVLSGLRDAGLKVPTDIAVVGFNNLPFADFLTPGLTTIDTRRREIGRRCAMLLIDVFEGRPVETSIDTGYELVVRGST